MNFKPSILKCSISLLSGVMINYLLAASVRVVCMLAANDPSARCLQPSWTLFALDPVPIGTALVVIALVYTIWSVIQKK